MAAETAQDTAYLTRELGHELRQAARQQHGDATTDEDLDGSKELKVEYRAAIVLDRQQNRIELLEATLRAIHARPGKDDEIVQLAQGAVDYPADDVPTAISTEDGDPAWVEVTPITETPEQAVAALKVNGMWSLEPDGTEYGYEVEHRVWMVPCVGSTERPLLTREAMASVQYEDEIVYFELNDQRGCETGSWWWHCTEFAKGPELDA